MPGLDNYTKLLLHFDGSDASTTIIDASGNHENASVVGTAQLDTDYSKFGPSSLLLDGNSDLISFLDSDDWAFGSGDFTIDFIVNFAAINKRQQFACQYATNQHEWEFQLSSDNKIQFWQYNSGWEVNISTTDAAISETGVYHIALVRSGNNAYIFVNGVSQSLTETVSFSGALENLNSILRIGAGYYNSILQYWLDGWIDEFRISKGVARWTSNFTPPIDAYGIPSLSGTVSGESTASGSLLVETPLAGSSATTGNVTGSLSVATKLTGSSGSSSSLTGSLSVATKLTGSSGSSSSLTGSLSVATKLTGSSGSSSSLTGSLSVATKLTGSSGSSSNLIGSLSGIGALTGSSTPSSNVTGSLSVLTSLSGNSAATSNVFGTLEFLSASLSGNSVATSNVSGALSVLTSLSGNSAAISNVSGAFPGDTVELNGLISSISSLSAELIPYPFDGRNRINAVSNVTGFLDIIPDLGATTLFWRPQANIIETLEWKTSVLKSHNGSEQRIKIRQSPRQHFRLDILLETDKLNTWIDSQLHRWQKSKWLVPVWPELVEHTADINHHDTFITVDTTDADFRDNSKAIIWKSRKEYEILIIDTVEDNKLNLSYTVLNNFTGLKYIIPVREAYMTSSSDKQRFNSEVSRITLIFKVYDNTRLTDYIPAANYDGYPVLAIPSYMNSTHGESSNPDVVVIDYETGTFDIVSYTDFNHISQQHKFINEGKSNCWNFRQFLHWMSGKQKTVLIPTFRKDLTLSSNIYGSDTTINIENIELADNMGLNSLRTYVGLYFPATNELIIRKITGITEISSTIEQITLDAAFENQTVADSNNSHLCFVDKCRFDSDRIEIRWVKAHENECETKFARIQ